MAMKIDSSGWLLDCEHVLSPNCDERPSTPIRLLVIHNISLPPGKFEGDGVKRFFTNTLDLAAHPYYASIAHIKVSAHFFVRRNGCIIQFVPCLKRAWHAGESCWQGLSRCNDFSIGVELEGGDDVPFTESQYVALGSLTLSLRAAYPICGIAGHSDIAPKRKTDPGSYFDWERYLVGLCET